jgi:phi13 family phage major tail protein
MANRIRIGASDMVYSLLNEASDVLAGTPTYGTIYPFPKLLDKVEVNLNGSAVTIFGDDAARDTAETVGEIDVTISVADLPPEDQARILGHTYASGSIAMNAVDASPWVAIGFKVLMTGGGFTYYWLYKGKFLKADGSHETKKGSINPQYLELKGKFVALQANNLYGNKLRTDDSNAPAGVITAYFNAPYFQTSDTTALSVAIAKGTAGDAGKIVATFSKVSATSFSIDAAYGAAAYFGVTDATGGMNRAGTYAVSGAGTTVTIKFTPTVAFTGAEDIAAIIHDIFDNSSVKVTQAGKVLTF